MIHDIHELWPSRTLLNYRLSLRRHPQILSILCVLLPGLVILAGTPDVCCPDSMIGTAAPLNKGHILAQASVFIKTGHECEYLSRRISQSYPPDSLHFELGSGRSRVVLPHVWTSVPPCLGDQQPQIRRVWSDPGSRDCVRTMRFGLDLVPCQRLCEIAPRLSLVLISMKYGHTTQYRCYVRL
jgi:hypothetical protein